jgi:hypothetical protein
MDRKQTIVVSNEPVAKPRVGGLDGVDPSQLELLRQAVLQRQEQALRPAARLRRVGRSHSPRKLEAVPS